MRAAMEAHATASRKTRSLIKVPPQIGSPSGPTIRTFGICLSQAHDPFGLFIGLVPTTGIEGNDEPVAPLRDESTSRPPSMILLAILLLAVLTVPLLGGRLQRLIDIDFGWTWLLVAAIGSQILIISIIPNRFEGIHEPLHFLSYALAGAFVIANIKLPGLWVIGLGGLMNLTAIAANGGVMPASAEALQAAGMATRSDEFVNSGVLEDPRLLFLGDIFSIPGDIAVFNTVFSVGDVAIALGTVLLVHGVCRTKLWPWGETEEQASVSPTSPPGRS